MGATARALLEQAAAQTWSVPVDECHALDHVVHHSSGKALGFGELAETAAGLSLPEPESVLDVTWKSSAHASHQSSGYIDALAEKVSTSEGEVARERGDVAAAFEANSRQVEAVYKTPYLAHASMEPPMATAHLHDGICEIWACTQTPQVTQREVANALFAATNKRFRELPLNRYYQV
jgi:CO/xanthine dehydrogenase Mo-binding subunit